ncbi:MAG: alpha-hydroxy acid oxidase [Pseudomonadota bacterium]
MPDEVTPGRVPRLLKQAAAIAHLERLAAKRLPRFVWDYVAGGCADDVGVEANRVALDAVELYPDYLRPCAEPSLQTTLFGKSYQATFGVAPLGLSGLIWPDASIHHARAAKTLGLPFVLSTMATNSIEEVADAAGSNLWFQLYPPADTHIRDDLLARARAAGVDVLVVTVDVPTPGRRPADIRSGLAVPPRVDLRSIVQSAIRPRWALAMARQGMPQFANLKPYLQQGNLQRTAAEIRFTLRKPVDLDTLRELRGLWHGTLVLKGILSPADAKSAVSAGADGLIVSNHGGRQSDAAPPTATALPRIVDAVGSETCVMVDGGVRSGTDIARYLALGAEAAFCGRAAAYGVAALGAAGAGHALGLLHDECLQILTQLRCASPAELSRTLVSPTRP